MYEDSLMTLSNCLVRNNRGRSGGGGLDVRHASRVAAYSSRIYANAATNSGGGGAMLEDGSTLIVRRQATVYLNTAVTRR